VLERWPDATGYGILFTATFIVLMGSWFSFATIRETPEPRQRRLDELNLLSNLRRMPRLMVADRGFRAYLIASFFLNGQFILIPFIAIHARGSLHLEEAFLGQLIMAQSVGALVGNLLAAWVGDRFGSKRPMTLGASAVLLLAVGASVAHSAGAYLGLFGLLGVALALTSVGGQALVLGVCPEEDKSTYLSLAGIVSLPAMIVSALVATTIPTDSMAWLALATGLCMVASLAALWFVPNPGQRQKA
jgi:predicted MFS family arabinose efflux permease